MFKVPSPTERDVVNRFFVCLGIAIAFAALFLLEPGIANYFGRGHFGWVSMHSLAISRHADVEGGFVGYSCRIMQSDGSVWYDYFNRYPFPFAALSKIVLQSLEGDSISYLYSSRQFMNLIYAANILVFVGIGLALGCDFVLAVAAAFVVGASPSWLRYKAMFHFDQPSLLCLSALVLLTILLHSSSKYLPNRPTLKSTLFVTSSAVAVVSGRSGAIIIYLFVCLALSFLGPNTYFYPMRRVLFYALVASIVVLAGFTAYSVYVEMNMNAVSLGDTSIIKSAVRRLGISAEGFSAASVKKLSWDLAIPRIYGHLTGFIPPLLPAIICFQVLLSAASSFRVFRFKPPSLAATSSLGRLFSRSCWSAGFSGISSWCLFRFQSGSVSLLVATFLVGVFWCAGMKNLVVFHSYAVMHIMPFFYILSLLSLSQCFVMACRSLERSPSCALLGRFLKALLFGLSVAIYCSFLFGSQARYYYPSLGESEELRRFFVSVDSFNGFLAAKRPDLLDALIVRDEEWMPRSPYSQCLLLRNPLSNGFIPGSPVMDTSGVSVPRLSSRNPGK